MVKSNQQSRRARPTFSQHADRDRHAIFQQPLQQQDDASIEDVEQFTYEREAKQMLAGPPGRKLSRPNACRLQHNLNKRRAIMHHRMSDYQVHQHSVQQ